MSGICHQNDDYWCPLQGGSCRKLTESCVLLVAGTGGDKSLALLGLRYEVTVDGKMQLKNLPK